VRVFGDAAFAGSGDGLDGEALGTAGGTAQALGEGGEGSVPAESIRQLGGGNPGRAAAGTVDIQQPAAAAVVAESVDMGERAHGVQCAIRGGGPSKRMRSGLYGR